MKKLLLPVADDIYAALQTEKDSMPGQTIVGLISIALADKYRKRGPGRPRLSEPEPARPKKEIARGRDGFPIDWPEAVKNHFRKPGSAATIAWGNGVYHRSGMSEVVAPESIRPGSAYTARQATFDKVARMEGRGKKKH